MSRRATWTDTASASPTARRVDGGDGGSHLRQLGVEDALVGVAGHLVDEGGEEAVGLGQVGVGLPRRRRRRAGVGAGPGHGPLGGTDRPCRRLDGRRPAAPTHLRHDLLADGAGRPGHQMGGEVVGGVGPPGVAEGAPGLPFGPVGGDHRRLGVGQRGVELGGVALAVGPHGAALGDPLVDEGSALEHVERRQRAAVGLRRHHPGAGRGLGRRGGAGVGPGRVEPLADLGDLGRHRHFLQGGEEDSSVGGPAPGRLGLDAPPVQLGAGPLDIGGQRGQRPGPLDGGGQGRVVGGGQAVELALSDLGGDLGLGGALVGRLQHEVVHVQPEEPFEQRLAVGGLVVEEARELALRQNDAAGEVGEAEADELLDGTRHVAGGGGDVLRRPVGGDPVEPGLPGADPAVASRAAHDAPDQVAVAAGLEGQLDSGLVRSDRDDRCDELLAVAGHAAVEGEAHGVDHRRLARAGGADESEQLGVGEVDLGLVAEGAEATQPEPDRPHQRSTPRAAS